MPQEEHILRVADFNNLRICAHYVDLTSPHLGISEDFTRWIGPASGTPVRIIAWTRDLEGVHFDEVVHGHPTAHTRKRNRAGVPAADTTTAARRRRLSPQRMPSASYSRAATSRVTSDDHHSSHHRSVRGHLFGDSASGSTRLGP